MATRAPYIPLPALRDRAAAFLAQHHPANTIPIPIEDIIDRDLRIDIVPLALSSHEIESFTSHDMSTFYVDKATYDSENTNRYRFSLAHELSHVILHEEIFANAGFTDVAGWKEFTASFGDDYKFIEWQAYTLAGLLLVPTQHLINEHSAIVKKLDDAGIDITKLGPAEMTTVAKVIADKFSVSRVVIKKRGIKEGLWEEDDITRD